MKDMVLTCVFCKNALGTAATRQVKDDTQRGYAVEYFSGLEHAHIAGGMRRVA
jgi:hypothetical protein